MSAIVQYFEHSLALPFLGVGMKTALFQSCGHWWVFQICWHIECNTLTASSFRIWNSSTGSPSPPLALFIAMLPKAHLTSHSRMSGSRWVVTPSWFSGSWRSKNWCFWTVVLEKTLEDPLDCKETQPVCPKGYQSWVFIGRTDAEADSSTLATWCEELTHWKRPWCWEDWVQEEKGITEDKMAGWHHRLDGHEFE